MRKPIRNKARDKAAFKSNATKTHKKNVYVNTPRGGIRL